jgi:hypothetical protein
MNNIVAHIFSPPPFLERLSSKNKTLFATCEWVKSVPNDFEDSTHQLWLCQFESETQFLKLCSIREQSTFWQAVQTLFGFELASHLEDYDCVYQTLAAWSPLVIPKLVHSASCTTEGGVKYSGFLLTEYLEGQALSAEQLTLKQVSQVAEHIALLHQQTSGGFGGLFEQGEISPPLFNENRVGWKQRLKQTLLTLNQNQTIPCEAMDKIVGLVKRLNIKAFHPIMLDLRWDQFLQQGGGKNLALLDLDAMVWGPRELELVLLEYLLTPEQAELFITVYTNYHDLPPNLDVERAVYRVLLFQMNVLGESDFNRWMAHPVYF